MPRYRVTGYVLLSGGNASCPTPLALVIAPVTMAFPSSANDGECSTR